MAAQSIKVAIELSKGILVHAKGPPAKIVAVGAAAAVVLVAAAATYGAVEGGKAAYKGGKALYGGVRGWLGKRNDPQT